MGGTTPGLVIHVIAQHENKYGACKTHNQHFRRLGLIISRLDLNKISKFVGNGFAILAIPVLEGKNPLLSGYKGCESWFEV